MPTINGPVTSVTNSATLAASNAFGATDASSSISTMPDASDPLVGMVNSGDIGSSIAALVMMTQKELRKAARQDRDALYKAQENAQREELDSMEDASNAKFIAGLTEGGLKLGSAACSFTSATTSFKSAQEAPQMETLQAQLKANGSLSASDAGTLKTLELNAADAKHTTDNLNATSTGLEAYGIIGKAVGGLVSDNAERDAKAAGSRADTFKRLAEGRADDAHDANKSIDKAVEFVQQWLSGKAAQSQAALHRA